MALGIIWERLLALFTNEVRVIDTYVRLLEVFIALFALGKRFNTIFSKSLFTINLKE